jgi:hypothetical protein
MRRILIELEDGEWDRLVAQARRDRRTAQAEAAQLLVDYLDRLEGVGGRPPLVVPNADAPRSADTWAQTRADVEKAVRAGREPAESAEADGAPGAADAGSALPPEEKIGPVEGHGDGA